MRYVSGIIKLLFFAVLLSFAVANSETVALHYYLGYQWQAPLVLVILVAFTLGAIVGVAASMSYLFQHRKETQRLRADLAACRALPNYTQAKTSSHEMG